MRTRLSHPARRVVVSTICGWQRSGRREVGGGRRGLFCGRWISQTYRRSFWRRVQ